MTIRLDGSRICMTLGGGESMSWDAASLLGFSCERPWVLAPLADIRAQAEGEDLLVQGISHCGSIEAQARFCAQGDQVMVAVSFKNISKAPVRHGLAQLGFALEGIEGENITIPHTLYNDNPSADPARLVAHVGKKPGDGVIVEEHRLPIPGVNVEWRKEGHTRCLTLLSFPEPGDGTDEQYWSLGVLREECGLRLQALSGQTMFNGVRDMVYAGKNAFVPFERAYRLLMPGERLQHRFCLELAKDFPVGQGFRRLVALGDAYLKPKTVPALPVDRVIALKTNCMDTRYHKDGEASGYLTFGTANSFGNKSGRPDYYLYGWTGQALKLAYCDVRLGDLWNQPERAERAIGTVDFYLTQGENKKTGGMRCGYYLTEKKQWMAGGWDDAQRYSTRIQGEALYDALDFMLLLRRTGRPVPAHWEEAVRRGLAFSARESALNAAGLYPLLWDENGAPLDHDINSAGISNVIAFARAYEYFGQEEYLTLAKERMGRYYRSQMADFSHPFSRATMDARCEDKEAGMFFFLAAHALYEVTGEDCYRDWAAVAADWILTFVYFWETGFKPGAYCADKGFRTTGWPGVSVQNHHLDVFFPCWEMASFGKKANLPFYERMGRLVADAFSHGICTTPGEWGFDVPGEQSEQFYQTNFFMSTYPELLYWVEQWRSGIRIWNPSWIIAQVLRPAIEFTTEEDSTKGCAT